MYNSVRRYKNMETVVEKSEKINELKKGTENQNFQQNKSGKPKKRKFIIVFIVIIIAISMGIGAIINNYNEKEKARLAEEERIRIEQEQKDNEYKNKIALACLKMNQNVGVGAKLSEAYLKLYNQYGSTLGKNYIVGTIKGTDGYEKIASKMKENHKVLTETMDWISSNKLENYIDVYNILLEMYDGYKPFYESTIDLNFSLYSTQEVITKGKTVLEKYDRITTMIPEIKDFVDNSENNNSDKDIQV